MHIRKLLTKPYPKLRSQRNFSSKINDSFLSLCRLSAYGKASDISSFAQSFDVDSFKAMLISTCHAGYTPLHYAAAQNTSEVVAYFVNALGNQSYKVAKQTANDGNIPITLLNINLHSKQKAEERATCQYTDANNTPSS